MSDLAQGNQQYLRAMENPVLFHWYCYICFSPPKEYIRKRHDFRIYFLEHDKLQMFPVLRPHKDLVVPNIYGLPVYIYSKYLKDDH